MGGLGNQMFQFACGRALAHRHSVELKLDHSFLENRKHQEGFTYRNYELNAFGINLRINDIELKKVQIMRYISKILTMQHYYKYVEEKDPYRANIIFPNYPKLYLSGYFQSEKYFAEISEIIQRDFTFIKPQSEYQNLINYIGEIENPISVLIRRDDFIKLKGDFLLKMEYYKRAIDIIKSEVRNPHFLIFTIGDTKWVKEHFKVDADFEIVENENPDLRGFEKMRLISLCKHNIIANSSFGWWGAWLNKNNEKIVVVPKKWLNDEIMDKKIMENRIPDKWIKL